MGDASGVVIITSISQVGSILTNKQIGDGELWSVSSHDNPMAFSNIEICWREAVLNTGLYAGGKTRWCFMRLVTPGARSRHQHTAPGRGILAPKATSAWSANEIHLHGASIQRSTTPAVRNTSIPNVLPQT